MHEQFDQLESQPAEPTLRRLRSGTAAGAFSLLFAATMLISGCGGDQKQADTPEGAAEEAGEAVDEAADDTKDAAEEGADEAQDAAEEAGDEVEDATDQ